jgi:transposase
VFAELAGDADFEEAFIDSLIVRAHQHAAGAAQNASRNRVERFFCRIEQFRHVATRYDKLSERFSSFAALAAAFIWLR